MVDPPGTDLLSARLRRGTRAAHDAARRNGFLDGLVTGRLPLAAYAEMTAHHWFIYESLESASSAMADDPVAGRFIFPALFRVPILESDLRFLYGPRWQSRISALPATTTYCTRLRSAAFDDATGFVAHHYTRYLGDLSGGQFLKRAVVEAYRFRRSGYRFFVFDGVDPALFKARYRERLDTVPWRRAEQDAFLAEVSVAYRLNTDVLNELAERWS